MHDPIDNAAICPLTTTEHVWAAAHELVALPVEELVASLECRMTLQVADAFRDHLPRQGFGPLAEAIATAATRRLSRTLH